MMCWRLPQDHCGLEAIMKLRGKRSPPASGECGLLKQTQLVPRLNSGSEFVYWRTETERKVRINEAGSSNGRVVPEKSAGTSGQVPF